MIQISFGENVNSGSWKITRIKKNNLRCHSDQIYATFHLVCYMLICFLLFSILENENSGSRKVFQKKKKSIYVAIVIKIMKQFIRIVRHEFVWFSLVCLKMGKVILQQGSRESKKAIYIAIGIKIMKHFIWIATC